MIGHGENIFCLRSNRYGRLMHTRLFLYDYVIYREKHNEADKKKRCTQGIYTLFIIIIIMIIYVNKCMCRQKLRYGDLYNNKKKTLRNQSVKYSNLYIYSNIARIRRRLHRSINNAGRPAKGNINQRIIIAVKTVL